MSDVRLVATNPEDSSLVPVACTPAGLIKTEVGTIEEVPNDLLISGNLTVTGTVTGSGGEIVGQPGPEGPEGPEGPPGPNVLLPYGPEDSVLIVKNGAPVWSTDWQPKEPPPPPPPVMLVDTRDVPVSSVRDYGFYNDQEILVTPPDPWDEFAQTLPTWTTPAAQRTGLGGLSKDGAQFSFPFTLSFGDSFNKVLELEVVSQMTCDQSVTNNFLTDYQVSVTSDNDKVTAITGSVDLKQPNPETTNLVSLSFLVTRDQLGPVNFTLTNTRPYADHSQAVGAWVQRWRLVDAGYWLLKKQLAKAEAETADLDPGEAN